MEKGMACDLCFLLLALGRVYYCNPSPPKVRERRCLSENINTLTVFENREQRKKNIVAASESDTSSTDEVERVVEAEPVAKADNI